MVINIYDKLISNDILSWEEKLLLSLIKSGNEYYKGEYYPTIKYLSEKVGMTQARTKFFLYKLIGVGLLEYKYFSEEKKSHYDINEGKLENVLSEHITLSNMLGITNSENNFSEFAMFAKQKEEEIEQEMKKANLI